MSNEININDLRSKPEENTGSVIMDPNLASVNTESDKKIVNPEDLGLPDRPKEVLKSDKEKGLDLIDKCVERKLDEVRRFNEAMDANGGELSENQWRAMNGEAATSILVDHIDPEAAFTGDDDKLMESIAKKDNANTENTVNNTEKTEEDELAELEAEADGFDGHANTSAVEEDHPSNNANADEYASNERDQTIAVHVTPEVKLDDTPMEVPGAATGIVEPDHKKFSSAIDDIDADIEALEGVTNNKKESEISEESFDDKLKAKIREKIISKSVISLDAYKIATDHPVTANIVLENRGKESPLEATFKWVLYHTGCTFTMKKFTADELDELSNMMNNRTTVNAKRMYETIYNHIVDGAGLDFESWARCVSRLDIHDLWMGVYGASFQYSNYIPYQCDKCKEATITDSTAILDMVKFGSSEIKDKFNEIYEMNPTNPSFGKTRAYAVRAISKTLAVKTKEPTMYETIIEPLKLDRTFTEKYSDIINLLPFIDELYLIDSNTMELRPVAHKVDPKNEVKTLKFKILAWAKIIRPMESDEKGLLWNLIATMSDTEHINDIQYCLPAATCDSCGAEIEETISNPAEMVFIRHQLTAFGALQ